MSSLAVPSLGIDGQQQTLDRFSVPISNRLALEIFSSTKPHNLKIAKLQKGLILACDGKHVVGEGTGFGFPVVIGSEETVFSGSATVALSKASGAVVVRKVFRMDRIARNKFGNVRFENRQARSFVRYLCDVYQKNRHLRSLWPRKALLSLGVEAAFEEAETVGNIPVTYEIDGADVHVQVDFSQIPCEHRKRVFVLNEQSASFFRRYHDSTNTQLADSQVGAWDNVQAETAWFTDARRRFGFRLWQVETAVLRRGRESMSGFLDWCGLDYELQPDVKWFGYKIGLLGAGLA